MDPFRKEVLDWAMDLIRRYESTGGGPSAAQQSEQEAQSSQDPPGASPTAGSSPHACSELVGSGKTGSPGVPGHESSSFLASGVDHSFVVRVHRGRGIYSSEMGLAVPMEDARRFSREMGWGTEWLEKPLVDRERDGK